MDAPTDYLIVEIYVHPKVLLERPGPASERLVEDDALVTLLGRQALANARRVALDNRLSGVGQP